MLPAANYPIIRRISIALALSLTSHTGLALAQQAQPSMAVNATQSATPVKLDQAELDQLLAPIALYPDTLLSHVLVAATYPLEVVQAARWRKANKQLDEQQALNAVEDKDWDPSVKALVPFNDLLQKFSDDLDWLQAIGDAFLSNEEQVLASVQNLRQKAYAAGNLHDNEYIDISKDDEDAIVIQSVQKEVVYVPYYDTRVVYGDWWWHDYPPLFWHRPSYYVWHAGFYWSPRYVISPAFYFGGFSWHERYVYVDHGYRRQAHRNWSYYHGRQIVRSKEYSRWQHDQHHRRGVHYTVNGRAVSRDYHSVKTPHARVINQHSQVKTVQHDKQRKFDDNTHPRTGSQKHPGGLHQKQQSERVKQHLQQANERNRDTKFSAKDSLTVERNPGADKSKRPVNNWQTPAQAKVDRRLSTESVRQHDKPVRYQAHNNNHASPDSFKNTERAFSQPKPLRQVERNTNHGQQSRHTERPKAVRQDKPLRHSKD